MLKIAKEFWRWLRARLPGLLVITIFGSFFWPIWEAFLAIAARIDSPAVYQRGVHAALLIFGQCPSFLGILALSLWILARFVLPVQTGREHRKVCELLLFYMLGDRGPTLYVRDGRKVAARGELQRTGEGVALVDAASGLVLERDSLEPRFRIQRWWLRRQRDLERLKAALEDVKRWFVRLKHAAWANDWLRLWWVVLFLLHWAWIIPGRRLRQLALVLGLIRPRHPGLPRQPVLVRVRGPGLVFIAEQERVHEALDLRWQRRQRRVKALTRDGVEIAATLSVSFILDEGYPASALPQRRERPTTFNPNSAFRAVYGTPIDHGDPGEKAVHNWADLPALVASDILRDLVSTEAFDQLYRPTIDNDFPLTEFRRRFTDRVQAEPVIAQRGIRVLQVTLSGLEPSDPAIKQQRLENWQADWQRRTIETLAGGDLEAVRIVQRARASAQHDLAMQLAGILQLPDAKAAIALRLFQALETASADPSTRRLLPTETVNMLSEWFSDLRGWFK
jgi:hypothetical protein